MTRAQDIETYVTFPRVNTQRSVALIVSPASNMNFSDASTAGPVELLYAGAEKILQLTQRAVAVDKLSDFVDSVRWKEPFIIALVVLQILLFTVVYKTKKNDIVQFFILVCITALALAAEKLNQLGRTHWRRFAKQNYFDTNGLFMLTFLSGPFVIQANFIVVC